MLRGIQTLVMPIFVLGLFILVSAALRPVLPPDETRYLTVAWEMLVNRDFIVPTFNFAAYHHKPPLLFWLIDLSWAVFGVSRVAALATVFAVSTTVMILTRRLAAELFPGDDVLVARVGWLTLGNVVFVIYAGLILFDLLLTACILGALIALLIHARSPSWCWIAIAGVAIGLGVLAKGPVVYLHLFWPIAAYPLWRTERQGLAPRAFWQSAGLAVLVSLLPVAAWVVPALVETNGEFARSLIWDQTAGRISGSLSSSHARPFWFYLPLLPIFAMPWIFSPYVWAVHKGAMKRPMAALREAWRSTPALRFLILWFVPVVASFSLIAGKQPHYLMPLLPAAVLVSAYVMRGISVKLIGIGTGIVLGLTILGQAGAALSVFPNYDLAPLARLVAARAGPVAFIGDYQGEFGFLGRLRRSLDVIDSAQAERWLGDHPDGMLVAIGLRQDEGLPGRPLLDAPFAFDRHMVANEGGLPPAALNTAPAADRAR